MPSSNLNFHPKVTVVVPAYNVEPYIEECIQSLFSQTLDDLEIIVVDDGSTDKTASIVSGLVPPSGKTLRLFSKPNEGASSARNFGIRLARGKWIGLVDGDDCVGVRMYADIVDSAEALNADIAICNGYYLDHQTNQKSTFMDNKLWKTLISKKIQLINPAHVPDIFILDNSSCRRVYLKSFLEANHFEFSHGYMYEDILANYQLLTRTSRVLLFNEEFYSYRINHPGRVTGRKDKKVLDVIHMIERSIDEIENVRASPELWANFIWFQNWVLLWLCGQIDNKYKKEFTTGIFRLAHYFPYKGTQFFRKKFQNDQRAQEGVFLQQMGFFNAYRQYAESGELSRLEKYLIRCETLRLLIELKIRLSLRVKVLYLKIISKYKNWLNKN